MVSLNKSAVSEDNSRRAEYILRAKHQQPFIRIFSQINSYNGTRILHYLGYLTTRISCAQSKAQSQRPSKALSIRQKFNFTLIAPQIS
jgi:hypothetical protein